MKDSILFINAAINNHENNTLNDAIYFDLPIIKEWNINCLLIHIILISKMIYANL